jgi:hypothetical protein
VGYWCKNVRGKLHYFGHWADPDAAPAKYLDQMDALHAGRKPRPDPDAITVKDVANDFLIAKHALVDAAELSARTWRDYKEVADLLVAHLGKGRLVDDISPQDFAPLRNRTEKRWRPHHLGKLIQYTRCLFKHGYEAGLIPGPVRYGPGYKRPSKKATGAFGTSS